MKVQLLLNEYQGAPFLFQNLSSLDRRNQQVKFKKEIFYELYFVSSKLYCASLKRTISLHKAGFH